MMEDDGAVWYESKEAMEKMEDVPRGSRGGSGNSGKGRVGATGTDDIGGEGEPDGGVAGRTGIGVSFGSGDGRIVRIDESDGAWVVVACCVGYERMTVVLYSENVEGVDFGSNKCS